MLEYDVIILGAGAAGLMCAMTAGGRGRRVLLLDHADAAGKKILISGGGRCNFTNLGVTPGRFLSANPHFAHSALARYSQHDFIALVRRHNIAFHEKTLGQLFCDGSAREIVAMLLVECAAAHVDLRLAHRVTDVTRAEHFRVETDRGTFTAPALVLATGGLSIPKMGATDLAHRFAARFGLPVTATRPGLVPLTFTGDDLELMQKLSGVALDVVASLGRHHFAEALLFTHRGLSGPAILQLSSYWNDGDAISLNLLPSADAGRILLDAKRQHPNAALRTMLAEHLPQRLAHALAVRHGDAPMATLRDKSLAALANHLTAWQLCPSGTEGFAKAEVTLGGIATTSLSQRSMQAHSVPGLFAIGEAVDVTGWLGGYNFQWAWSSGWCAGMEV